MLADAKMKVATGVIVRLEVSRTFEGHPGLGARCHVGGATHKARHALRDRVSIAPERDEWRVPWDRRGMLEWPFPNTPAGDAPASIQNGGRARDMLLDSGQEILLCGMFRRTARADTLREICVDILGREELSVHGTVEVFPTNRICRATAAGSRTRLTPSPTPRRAQAE